MIESMPSLAIISSNAAGAGKNVGGAFASRIATGDRYTAPGT